jgi:hypothetical protein
MAVKPVMSCAKLSRRHNSLKMVRWAVKAECKNGVTACCLPVYAHSFKGAVGGISVLSGIHRWSSRVSGNLTHRIGEMFFPVARYLSLPVGCGIVCGFLWRDR